MNKMEYNPINFEEKLAKFSGHWSPRIIGQLNDYHLKVVKVLGEFVWHAHPETDEVFIVLKGRLDIHFRDGVASLNENEMYVVPNGVEHKPVAEQECHILLIEPAGTVNTGNVDGGMAAPNDVWI
jgi:mannose-6-phosphate isomerase-like protein (cupin superfamily)